MPGIGANPPLVRFGLDSSMQNSVQFTLFNAVAADDNLTGIGSTAATAYPINAGISRFVTVPLGTGAVLPSVSGTPGLTGASLYIAVDAAAANVLTVYPHPNDVGGTINGAASVVLGAATITPFQNVINGRWFADGIGTGAAGSIETIVSQGTLAATGNNQGTAAVITQAMVNVTSSAGSQGVLLPPAAAGLQIVVNDLSAAGNTPLIVYPQGTQTINGVAGPAGLSLPLPMTSPTLFYCFTAGAWVTK